MRRIETLAMNVVHAAAEGKTSLWIYYNPAQYPPSANEYLPTNEDLLAGFQTKFPECDVRIEEREDLSYSGNRVKRVGFLVDWS